MVNTNSGSHSNSSDGTYVLGVPTVVVTSTINAGVGGPPNPPTIGGPMSGDPNTTYTYTFTATDGDGDTIRYRIDWDNNGTVDQTLPGSGHVPSGTQLSASRSWPSAGEYTFQAYTEDNQGNSSSWTQYVVTIGSGSPQCSDGIDNDGDGNIDYPADTGCTSESDNTESPNAQCSDGIDNNGNGLIDYPNDPTCSSARDNNEEVVGDATISLTVSRALIQKNETTTLNWEATEVQTDSCTLSGSNGDLWNLSGGSGTQTSSPIVEQTIFTLRCTDLSGDPVSTAVTVKISPSFEEI